MGEFIQHGSPRCSISCANIYNIYHAFIYSVPTESTEDEREIVCALCVCMYDRRGENKCCDPCVLGLQVILKCHGIRHYATAQVSSVIQIDGTLFPSTYAVYIDRNVTRASVFHVDYNKSTEVLAVFQLQQSKLKMFRLFFLKKVVHFYLFFKWWCSSRYLEMLTLVPNLMV